MADDLKIALGSKFTKKIDRAKKDMFEDDDTDKISLASQISNIKNLQGELGTSDIVNLFNELNTAINISLGNIQKTIGSAMGSIQPKIKDNVLQIIKEFKTGSVDEQLNALKKLEQLQNKFNINLVSFNEKFGTNIDGLSDALDDLKQIESERKSKLKEEAQNLKERGIITKIEGKGTEQTLKILTNRDLKTEDLKIRRQERLLENLQDTFNSQLKQFQKGKFDKLEGETNEQAQKRISDSLLKMNNSIEKFELSLQQKKERMGFENRPESGIRRAVRVGGEFLRGERGPQVVQQGMGSLYASATAPIDAVKQLYGSLNMALFDLPDKLKNSLSKSLGPALSNLGKTLSSGFSGMIKSSMKGFQGLGSILLIGFTKLAAALGLSKVGGMIGGAVKAVGGGLMKVGGAAIKGIGAIGGTGLAAGIGLGAAVVAPVAALAIAGRPKNEEEAEYMKENNSMVSGEAASDDTLSEYNAGRKEARAAGEARIARGEDFKSLADSQKSLNMEVQGVKSEPMKGEMPPIEATLRRKRERDNDMPLPGEFAGLSKDYAMTKDMAQPIPPIVNAIAPTNVSNVNRSESFMAIEVLNRDPTFLNLNVRTV